MKKRRSELIGAILGKLDEMTEEEMRRVILVYESSRSQQGTFQVHPQTYHQDDG